MAPQTPEARLKIIAENLARAALQEAKRDVQAVGTAATGTASGFGKMVFQNGQLIASTSNARRGVHLFENALRTLSFQAAGIPGPVGKAAQGIGMLGIGSLWVTAAIAGVGGVALAIRAFTADAREAGTAADELAKSVGQLTLGGKFRAIGGNLTEAGQGVFAAQSRAQGGPLGGNPILEWIALIKQGALEDAGEKAVAAVLAVRAARDQDQEKLIQGLEREAQVVGLSATAVARLRAEWAGLDAEETGRFVAAARRLERRNEENRVLKAQRDILEEISRISGEVSRTFDPFDVQHLRLPTAETFRAQEGQRVAGLQVTELQKQGEQFAFGLDQSFFDRVQADVDDAISGLDEGGRSAGMIMAQSFVLALPGLMSGKAGGIFAGAGSILTGASALKGAPAFLGPAGFVLGALGTAFSLFDRNEDRRHKELVDAINRQGQEVGKQIRVIVWDPRTNTMHELREADEHDAVVRVPGYAGMTG